MSNENAQKPDTEEMKPRGFNWLPYFIRRWLHSKVTKEKQQPFNHSSSDKVLTIFLPRAKANVKRGQYDGQVGICSDEPCFLVYDEAREDLMKVEIPKEAHPCLVRLYARIGASLDWFNVEDRERDPPTKSE